MAALVQVMVVIDGRDVYDYFLHLPSLRTGQHQIQPQCYLGGGVVSNHTKERHIRMVSAEHTTLSWKLSSLYIFKGMWYDLYTFKLSVLKVILCQGFHRPNLASLLYQLGPECVPSAVDELEHLLKPSYIEFSNGDPASGGTVVGNEPWNNAQLYHFKVWWLS